MKLPQYDNSPPPGTPLYSHPSDSDGDWPILKWAAGFVGMIACLVFVAYVVLDGWRNFF